MPKVLAFATGAGSGRLLTLTGSGGSGKTRLALRAAEDLLDDYSDGVWLTELAQLSDPELVVQEVADALNVRDAQGQALLATLCTALQDKHLLLILDNLEHLLASAQLVGDLLDACPRLTVLVTSRTVLHLAREQVFEVSPLAMPDPKQAADLRTLGEYEPIRLFCERAQAAQADFVLTTNNVGHSGVRSDLLGQAGGTRGSLGGNRMPLEHHDALAAPRKMERDAGAERPSPDDHRVGCVDQLIAPPDNGPTYVRAAVHQNTSDQDEPPPETARSRASWRA